MSNPNASAKVTLFDLLTAICFISTLAVASLEGLRNGLVGASIGAGLGIVLGIVSVLAFRWAARLVLEYCYAREDQWHTSWRIIAGILVLLSEVAWVIATPYLAHVVVGLTIRLLIVYPD